MAEPANRQSESMTPLARSADSRRIGCFPQRGARWLDSNQSLRLQSMAAADSAFAFAQSSSGARACAASPSRIQRQMEPQTPSDRPRCCEECFRAPMRAGAFPIRPRRGADRRRRAADSAAAVGAAVAAVVAVAAAAALKQHPGATMADAKTTPCRRMRENPWPMRAQTPRLVRARTTTRRAMNSASERRQPPRRIQTASATLTMNRGRKAKR
jgi:hypothetical protein